MNGNEHLSSASEADCRRKDPARRFRRRLLCWCGGLLALGLAFCAGLYVYLDVFEKTRPERSMDALLAETPDSVWNDCALQGLTEALSPYDNAEELKTSFEKTYLQSGEYTYRRERTKDGEDTLTFCIRSGGADLCSVVLREKADGLHRFGRHEWEAAAVEPRRPVNLSSVTVSVEAMPGERVFVNGLPLTEEYIKEENVAIEDLTPPETRFAAVPHRVRYEIPAMFGSVTVTDGEGREISPQGTEGDAVRYVTEGEKHTLTVTAPQDVTVYVGGAALTEAEVTHTGEALWAGLENYVAAPPAPTVTYALTDLYTLPEVTAVGARGESLTALVNERGELRFFRGEDEALKQQMEGTVRRFFEAYMDYSSRAYDELRQVVLLCTILPGSELYSYVQDSRDAMIWASATEVSYDELRFEDFCSMGENCFTCTIRYKADFTAQSWYKSYSYDMQNAYEMVFVRSDGEWLAAVMAAV